MVAIKEETDSKVSCVIPVYNEEGNIPILINRIVRILENNSSYEIIFVDDGSSDNSLNIIKEFRKTNQNIHFLEFSRNFGHQNALKAGIDSSSGDCIITLDGDLQHPPELIPTLIERWKEGYDVVYTCRKYNSEAPIFKRITSGLFYRWMNLHSELSLEQGLADFRLIDRKVADIIRAMKENPIFLRGMVKWLGFNQACVEFVAEGRHSGSSKYSLLKMMKFAVSGITSFSVMPLRLATFFGLFISFLAFLYGVYALIIKIFTNQAIPGWTSILVLIAFLGGVQLIMIGILGEYLGRLFLESKNRPCYIIKGSSLI